MSYWQQYKLSYLRKHEQLDFNSMRRLKLPKQVIKQILLEDLKHEYTESFQ